MTTSTAIANDNVAPQAPSPATAPRVEARYAIKSAAIAPNDVAPMPFRTKRACRVIGAELPAGAVVTTVRIGRELVDLRPIEGQPARTLAEVLAEVPYESTRGGFVVVSVRNDSGRQQAFEGQLVVCDERGDEATAQSMFGSTIGNPTQVAAPTGPDAREGLPRSTPVAPAPTPTAKTAPAAAQASAPAAAAQPQTTPEPPQKLRRVPASRRPMWDRPASMQPQKRVNGMKAPKASSKMPGRKPARPAAAAAAAAASQAAAATVVVPLEGERVVVLHRGHAEMLRSFLVRGAPLQDDVRRGRRERTFVFHALRNGLERAEGVAVEAEVGQVAVSFALADLDALVTGLQMHREHTLADERARMGASLVAALDLADGIVTAPPEPAAAPALETPATAPVAAAPVAAPAETPPAPAVQAAPAPAPAPSAPAPLAAPPEAVQLELTKDPAAAPAAVDEIEPRADASSLARRVVPIGGRLASGDGRP